MRFLSSRTSRLLRYGLVALAVVAAAPPLWTSPVAAAGSFVVDDPGDAPDVAPGDGSCATAGSTCTLRAAVQEGGSTGGTTSIVFDPSVERVELGDPAGLEFPGSLTVDSTVVITGTSSSGATTIDASFLDDRHFVVGTTGHLELHDVNLFGGDAGSGDGGAVLNSGRVLITGRPTALNPRVPVLSNNRAANGGAIANEATGTVEIRNESTATVQTRVDMSGNSAAGDGGTFLNSGSLRLVGATGVASADVYVDGSVAGGTGGALANRGGETVVGCRAFLRFAQATNGGDASVAAGTLALAGGGLDGGVAVSDGGGAYVAADGVLDARVDPGCNNTAQISRSATTSGTGAGGGAYVLGRLEVDAGATLSISGDGVVGPAAHFGGGLAVHGAGSVQVDGQLQIQGTTAQLGGGLHLLTTGSVRTGPYPAAIAVTDSSAGLAGGGVSVGEGRLAGRVALERNTAPTGGGLALAVLDDPTPGLGAIVDLVQSRIVGNTATTGAAIQLEQMAGRLDVTNSTIADNVSADGGVVVVDDGDATLSFVTVVDNAPLGVSASAPVQLNAALLASNGTANCAGSPLVLDGGAFNLADDTTCHPEATDIDQPSRYGEVRSLLVEQNPGEFLPGDGHAAIDGVGDDPASGTCAGLVDDQRELGVRPADGDMDGVSRCDVGAFEIQASTDGEDRDTWPLSGTVYDERTNQPLQGVCVFVGGVDDPDDGAMLITRADGTYSGDAPEGTYLVGFFVPGVPVDPDDVGDDGDNGCSDAGFSSDYQPEWYRNVAIDVTGDGGPVFPDPAQVELVVVDGAAVAGVDACLGAGPGPGLDAPCASAVPAEPVPATVPGPGLAAAGADASRSGSPPTPGMPLAFVG